MFSMDPEWFFSPDANITNIRLIHLGIIQAGESYNVYLECNQNKTIVLDINSMELGVSDFRRHYKFVVKYQQPKQFLLVMHQLFL